MRCVVCAHPDLISSRPQGLVTYKIFACPVSRQKCCPCPKRGHWGHVRDMTRPGATKSSIRGNSWDWVFILAGTQFVLSFSGGKTSGQEPDRPCWIDWS